MTDFINKYYKLKIDKMNTTYMEKAIENSKRNG